MNKIKMSKTAIYFNDLPDEKVLEETEFQIS